MALIESVGPVDALRVAEGTIKHSRQTAQDVSAILSARESGYRQDPLPEALTKWARKSTDPAPERDIATIERLGGRLLIPEDEEWPDALLDLDLVHQPICLWARGGNGFEIPAEHRSVALVGSRDSTNYGNAVTADLAASLSHRGFSVVSGGAYGIDATAHRAAMATGGAPTLAVSACGLDRYYPAGNEDLLRTIANQGMLISEVPPGTAPTRWRFLQRNRIMAALSAVTVVVEARWRSGALNTVRHAIDLNREVGAVPGSVHSANSAGCHRLLREGTAVCVSDAGQIIELAGSMNQQMTPEPNLTP